MEGRHKDHVVDKASSSALSFVLGFAGSAVIFAVCALIFVAFQHSWDGFGDNKGEVASWQLNSTNSGDVVAGIHVPTGLIVGAGFSAVKSNCTNCHSAQLVTQNRASRDGWKETIRWMQKTQGLWDLGASESVILDYLAENYGPQDYGRRANLQLDSIEWYILDVN